MSDKVVGRSCKIARSDKLLSSRARCVGIRATPTKEARSKHTYERSWQVQPADQSVIGHRYLSDPGGKQLSSI